MLRFCHVLSAATAFIFKLSLTNAAGDLGCSLPRQYGVLGYKNP